jgi:hypothetical protein
MNSDGSVISDIAQNDIFSVNGITENGLIAGNYRHEAYLGVKGFTVNQDGSNWTGYDTPINGVNNLGQVATSTYETVQTGAHGQYSFSVLTYAQTAINDNGLVAGHTGRGLYGGQTVNVFLKDAAGNTILSAWEFGSQLAPEGYPAWYYSDIADITNTGDFILNASNGHAYLARAVPEPATIALMLLGLAGIGAATTRRRQQG